MNGMALAQEIATTYQTRDPLLLAQRAGIAVAYAHWEPVTYGEFDRRSRTITLNLRATAPLTCVLAHELGHYFAEQAQPGLAVAEHEAVALIFERFFGYTDPNDDSDCAGNIETSAV
jgi:Zn-dependent peptidase ImmA (M78 family)